MIRTIECKSAEDLVNKLFPLCSLAKGGNFIFRGESDFENKLVPSALRKDKVTGRTKAAMPRPSLDDTSDNQAFYEYGILSNFVSFCDAATITLPGDSYELRQKLLSFEKIDFAKFPDRWPSEGLFALLAAAQHYGVPTRLLDWTRNALVAAYFAARWAGEGAGQKASHLHIWVLNLVGLHQYEAVEIIPMPGANSPNLGAQKDCSL